MAKISAKYKVIYIIDPAQGEEGIAALVEKFKAMVEAEGTLVSLDELDRVLNITEGVIRHIITDEEV